MPKPKANELHMTRLYDAPAKLIWEVWTDPKHVGHWWGPRGFTLTHHSKDFRPGGHWHYTMHGPDGTDYENTTIYHEIDPHKKMVYDHGGHKERPPLFRVTMTLHEEKGKTRLEMTMAFKDENTAIEMAGFIKKAGGHGTWDRLAEYLDDQKGKNRFYINRSFKAPQEVVFKMWSDPKHLSQWLAPVGTSMKYIKEDLRAGGESFYSMSADDGSMTLYGKVKYHEINPIDRLVYTQWFTDKDGKVSRHPFAPVWPETMDTVVTFAAEGPDQTRVTVQWEPGAKASAEEVKFFRDARAGMTQGWTGSFDKLEALLA